ncbi:hypothetical protein Pth03_63350 [Planotetraspora thailandica]|uniref:Uncharacterized protein n=1 Tax=Planotetraspora thailandica TaxID=487172 RepID=A0A8J3VAC5_9ACTN|nr:hypothetical protein Pth03_63350 [Planotetraspora thailandica]
MAYGFATAPGNPPVSLMVLTIIVYVVMFAWLGALFLPSTRTPYDLLGGTRVVPGFRECRFRLSRPLRRSSSRGAELDLLDYAKRPAAVEKVSSYSTCSMGLPSPKS